MYGSKGGHKTAYAQLVEQQNKDKKLTNQFMCYISDKSLSSSRPISEVSFCMKVTLPEWQ